MPPVTSQRADACENIVKDGFFFSIKNLKEIEKNDIYLAQMWKLNLDVQKV